MANDTYSQQALAADPTFHARVRSALGNVAWQVLEEATTTANHQQRANYAYAVINNLASCAQQVSGWLVERPNILAANTTYGFPAMATLTDATDAAIESQLATDWDEMAGVGLSTTPVALAPGAPPVKP